ncbi:MAG: (Fe-S)-binding protein, partial [Raoultibacter sp.]
EVPRDAQDRSIGAIARTFAELSGDGAPDTDEKRAAYLLAVAQLAQTDPSIIFAVRRCCMCSYCTVTCPVAIEARAVFAALREILSLAGVVTEAGFESTQVDKEWHIFSVYRAVYGIYYVDLPHMDQAQELGADTLFFPGCPLASYAPELTREVYSYLGEQGINAVISEACCGSPLKSAGFGDRARAFKQRFAEEVEAAGIKRVICVCPGCMKELQGAAPSMGTVEFVALPALLRDAGVSIADDALVDAAAAQGVAAADANVRVTVFDSCFDRDGTFGSPLRSLLPAARVAEMEHSGTNALCCGAGGAVSLVDPDLSVARAQRVFDEGADRADLIVTNCPTCAYTLAYQARSHPGDAAQPAHANYLELVFENRFDWDTAFSQLEGMWSGEYGPWVIEQLT